MEPVCIKLVSIFDRLAHDSTTDQDALQSVYGLRRVLKGEMPSTLLRMETETRSTPKAKQVTDLQRRVARLQAEKVELENQIIALRSQVNETVHQTGHDYSYLEVMEIIRDKFGKQNGGLTLWADYSARLHQRDPSSQLLTASRLQSWRIAGSYPDWAVQQLLAMPVCTRTTHKWSDEDIDFLCNLHLADPQKTDDQLAVECSERFGCEINSNSIKSKFNILRRMGRIPMLRPRPPS